MRKLLLPSALLLALLGGSGAALADSDAVDWVEVPRDQWLSVVQIAERFTAQGYEVRKVEVEDKGYEVYAVTKEGRRMELYVNPGNGEVLKSEEDD